MLHVPVPLPHVLAFLLPSLLGLVRPWSPWLTYLFLNLDHQHDVEIPTHSHLSHWAGG